MSSHLRVHWDRVFLLLAAVIVLLVLLGHAIFRAAGTGPADSTSAAPAQVAPPPAKPCPQPAPGVLRTMPGGGDQRTVALTFDDGPGPLTDDILAVLARENVPATFFVVGNEAAANAELVRQMHAAGHAVENHSWSHPSANQRRGWSRRLLQTEIRRTSEAITRITGQPPCYFRPPQGVIKGAEEATRAAGLTLALWSVDTRDWATRGRAAAERIRTRARAGLSEQHPVVLLHDGGGNRTATLAALPDVIEDYRSHGYTFVLLDGHS